jgi:hypothetical protein
MRHRRGAIFGPAPVALPWFVTGAARTRYVTAASGARLSLPGNGRRRGMDAPWTGGQSVLAMIDTLRVGIDS